MKTLRSIHLGRNIGSFAFEVIVIVKKNFITSVPIRILPIPSRASKPRFVQCSASTVTTNNPSEQTEWEPFPRPFYSSPT
jgi:hypothetical protein